MDYLPNDPMMLVSSVNMLLRDDEFDSFESLCSYFDKDVEELKKQLLDNGFVFNEEQRQFRPL
ncbi:MAG: DUF4250 domain-containing protein [Bacteroidaceae bacterium]|nr:DUF4250 domain-containing protein [Bacteroidaceae bacterium]